MRCCCRRLQGALLPLALLLGVARAFLVPASPARGASRLQMASHPPSPERSSSFDRQGFLKGLGIAGAAGLLAPALLGTSPLPQPAQAIGQLEQWADDARFAQHLVVNVPDMEAAVAFYTEGLQAKVLRTRKVNDLNSTFIGFGPETLTPRPDFYPGVSSLNLYGAHFSLELNEVPRTAEGDLPILDPGTAVAYLQLAVPSLRISKLAEAGGIIKSAYGWVVVDAPGGLRHQVIVGDRRDPVMMLALNVPDMKKAVAFYRDVLGMREVAYPLSRAPESIYEPKQPKGSTYLAYNEDGLGVLLLPYKPQRGQPKTVRPGGVVDKLAIATDNVYAQVAADGADGPALAPASTGAAPAGLVLPPVKYAGPAPGIGTKVVVSEDPNGVGVVLVEYQDLEKELKGV